MGECQKVRENSNGNVCRLRWFGRTLKLIVIVVVHKILDISVESLQPFAGWICLRLGMELGNWTMSKPAATTVTIDL